MHNWKTFFWWLFKGFPIRQFNGVNEGWLGSRELSLSCLGRSMHQWPANGMVWYCNGMVWYCMVWYRMVGYDITWCGMEFHGMGLYGMILHGIVLYHMMWYSMVWYGTVWYGIVSYGMVWYGILYGMVWYSVGNASVASQGPSIKTATALPLQLLPHKKPRIIKKIPMKKTASLAKPSFSRL